MELVFFQSYSRVIMIFWEKNNLQLPVYMKNGIGSILSEAVFKHR